MLKKERFIMYKSTLIKLTEIREEHQYWPINIKKFVLGELIINPVMILMMRSAANLKQKILNHDAWPHGLDERVEFTEIHLDSRKLEHSIIYTIGNLEVTTQKLGGYCG